MNSMMSMRMVPRNSSLQAFSDYRDSEVNPANRGSAVTTDGTLLEYETLELRVHPPNVKVDNTTFDDRTVITVDSANRPGTLVEVVQCLTELGLNIKTARISSDGGWFVDEFQVTDIRREMRNGQLHQTSCKVTDQRKLGVISKLLSVEMDVGTEQEVAAASGVFDEPSQVSTVFELVGTDRVGLLADVIELLTMNGASVFSAAVWTYRTCVAFVISVAPINDPPKLQAVKERLLGMMDGRFGGIVAIRHVKGCVHSERRLHMLLLEEEKKEWMMNREVLIRAAEEAASSQNPHHRKLPGMLPPSNGSNLLLHQRSPSSVSSQDVDMGAMEPSSFGDGGGGGTNTSDKAWGQKSHKFSRPEVAIQHDTHLNYWLVTIKCKDRNKLFFDSVCTLADLDFDTFHGAIDSDEGGTATQLYYVRPRTGEFNWDLARAVRLQFLLEAAIQRRFPKGVKVHVDEDKKRDSIRLPLPQMTMAFKEHGLLITRAKVRAYAGGGHTFYLMDANHCAPETSKVTAVLAALGGRLSNSKGMLAGPDGPHNLARMAAAGAAAHSSVAAHAGGGGGGVPPVNTKAIANFFTYTFNHRGSGGSPSSFSSA